MKSYHNQTLRQEIESINKEQKALNPHKSTIKVAVDRLFGAHQAYLGSNVDKPTFDYATDNHLTIGNVFPDFAERLVIALRNAGLKAGDDFKIDRDEHGSAAAGSRMVLINKNAMQKSSAIAAAMDQSRSDLVQLAAAKK
ncbi:MAG: hypothetical protein LW823_08475 [Rickettsiales bacterium]|jgi:hypothetical protein|nr:hypothetical protein [Rickettsiales bacterium]